MQIPKTGGILSPNNYTVVIRIVNRYMWASPRENLSSGFLQSEIQISQLSYKD